jgi:DNA-binding NarL/FixJ family response regulator
MGRPKDPMSISFLRVGEAEFAVISAPIASGPTLRTLTPAETSVLSAILRGKANREIAIERRSSIHTVANQAASLYRKLHVTSRVELMLQQIKSWRDPG